MNRQFSIYLDVIRFTAAILVFISHVPGFAGGWLWQIAGFGHEAVVVFFVLSGFVISYVVFEKGEDAKSYAVSRLSRIYSVVFPALFITLFLYYIGLELNEEAFDSVVETIDKPFWTVFTALTFTNQSWVATPILWNLPYWSLGYEVLYYIFFGVFIYSNGRKRVLLLTFVCLLMGPSILLYLPIWFAGVFCFKQLKRYKLSLNRTFTLYIFSILGIVLFSFDAIQSEINDFMRNLIGSSFYSILLEPADKFSSDYVLAFFVTLHIFSSYHLTENSNFFKISNKFRVVIKELSSHTFSLYLFHMPMLYFVSIIAPYESNVFLNLILCWFILPISILWISGYTENKKSNYKLFFEMIFNRAIKFSRNYNSRLPP
jgi:peptidoglycan/LPS O-acetylase OafA/YrhL